MAFFVPIFGRRPSDRRYLGVSGCSLRAVMSGSLRSL
jgi:hypothetical protein